MDLKTSRSSWLTRLAIGPRLACSHALILVLLAAVCLVSLFSLSRIQANVVLYDENFLPSYKTFHDLGRGADEIRIDELKWQTDAGGERGRLASAIGQRLGQMDKLWRDYEVLVIDEQDRMHFDAVQKALDAYRATLDSELSAGESADIVALRTSSAAAHSELQDSLVQYWAYGSRLSAEFKQQAVSQFEQVIWVLMGLGFAALALGALAAAAITLSIVRPLRQVTVAMRAMSQGQLDVQILPAGRDELAELLRTLSEMSLVLRTTVQSIRDGMQSMSAAAAEIASANADLSHRTESQDARLTAASRAMGDITGAAGRGAELAAQARESAEHSASVAQQSSSSSIAAGATMGDVRAAGKRIADIIGLIDGMAYQTNLLALNASVESAHAGSHDGASESLRRKCGLLRRAPPTPPAKSAC